MRLPARAVHGHLILTRDGAGWALWRIEPAALAHAPERDLLDRHAHLRAAFMTLPRRSQLLGVSAPVDAEAVHRRLTAGVAAPAWPEAAERARRTTARLGGVERLHVLAAEVVPATSRSAAMAALQAVTAAFGAPPPAATAVEEARVRRAAEQLQRRLSAHLDLAPLSSAELCWLYARAPLCGRTALPVPVERRARSRPVLAHLGDALFHEGGTAGDADRPAHRRYLRVETDAGVAFQTFACLTDMPDAFDYPGGGDWFAAVDQLDFPVDWCARVRAVPNADAQRRTRRQQRQLMAQLAEYDGEPAGAPLGLATALEGVADQQAELVAHPAEPELEVTVVFALAAADLPTLEERAARLVALLEPRGYGLARPTGGQLALYGACLPAGPLAAPVDDYTQHLLCRDLAAGAPFAGSDVGDPVGMLLGWSSDSGAGAPVLFDSAYGPATNRSGSLGAFGALGSGKSYFVKRVAAATVARGGRVVVLDRTASGEYAAFAAAVPGSAEVVTLDAESEASLDPLRSFGERDRVAVAIGFLTLLTQTPPASLDGAVLGEAVRRVADGDGRLAEVVEALDPTDPAASAVRRKIGAFRSSGLADLVFAEREPLQIEADYVCFHAPALALPDRDVLLNPHLARQLLPEQLFSQALLYLVAAAAKIIAFGDRRRFAAALFDEAWALTASPQGRQLLLDGIRDGRKHHAAVWLVSQHPDDLGDDALAHLLANRFVFRQPQGAGARALAFLGTDATADAVRLVEGGLATGECLYRDVRDRIGRVRVLEAETAVLRAALDTTPRGWAGDG